MSNVVYEDLKLGDIIYLDDFTSYEKVVDFDKGGFVFKTLNHGSRLGELGEEAVLGKGGIIGARKITELERLLYE